MLDKGIENIPKKVFVWVLSREKEKYVSLCIVFWVDFYILISLLSKNENKLNHLAQLSVLLVHHCVDFSEVEQFQLTFTTINVTEGIIWSVLGQYAFFIRHFLRILCVRTNTEA